MAPRPACRSTARSRAATTSSGACAAAASTISPIASPAPRTCGTARPGSRRTAISPSCSPTARSGRWRPRRDRPSPVPDQPPFHRAALAVGRPRRPRRDRDRLDADRRSAAHAALRRRLARHLCRDGRRSWTARSAACWRALAELGLDRRHDRRLHQRQWRRALLRHLAVHRHARPSCSKAACGSRRSCAGRASSAPGSDAATQPIMSMDWLPTFLAAAGGAPDADFPGDGVDIGAAVAGRRPAGTAAVLALQASTASSAARRGRLEVSQDRRQRASCSTSSPIRSSAPTSRTATRTIFAGLVAAWQAWNAGMLPHDPAASSYGFTGEMLADHFGVED